MGGSSSVMPRARSTAAARWLPLVTERLVTPLPRSISTTRMDFSAANASVAERSLPAALSLLFDGPMQQVSQRGDKDVGLHTISGLMIDRSHVDDVLEIGKRAFDFGEFFVETYRLDC